jgi:hypothetical protein
LAFYICYLITYEVHSVNCSYVEDNYFILNREKSSKQFERISFTLFKF